MACCKIYLALSALLMCYVNANYEYERIKALSYLTDVSPSSSQYDIYEGASSELAPHYYDSYESNRDRDLSGDHFASLYKRSPIDSFKRESIEKKNLKKVVPFYAFPNKDLTKRKKLSAAGTEHCQEIKVKSFGKNRDVRKGVTTCYKCKDPTTRSTYERCSYKSHPRESASASTQVERYMSVPAGFRYRRSNTEKGEVDYAKVKRGDPYRFTDKYFTDATYDAPTESKEEKCDKVVKDSMVCMVCQNTKTNSKYEQCSYVKQPREEAYFYNKSNSFRDEPPKQRSDNAEYPESSSHSEPSDFAASDRQKDRNSTATEYSPRYYHSEEDYPEKVSTASKRYKVHEEAPSHTDCKQIKKDSKICTVCKDSKTGGTYEKCTFNYPPSDKLYKYSRSKSFGYPDKDISHSTRGDSSQPARTSEESKDSDHPRSSDSTDDYLDEIKFSAYPRRSDRDSAETQAVSDPKSASRDSSDYSDRYTGSSDYQLPSSNNDDSKYYGDQAVPSSKSVSEDRSENIKKDHCKEVQKDSMTCTICKDPKTGNDFEQCSYSYYPSDKLFAYSKSSSFGNPQRSDRSQQAPRESGQSSSESLESSTSSYDDEYAPGEIYEASTAKETKSEDDAEGKAVDTGYLDTVKKRAQIEEFMQNFQKQDRSKCKKIMRDKMTCYQCVDEDGFQKEECVFVTGRESGDSDQLAFRELKEFQVDPASRASQVAPSSRTDPQDSLEPSASASGNTYVRLERPDSDYPDEKPHAAEEAKETEPYDYTSETRSKYDKVLGLTLPAYMFAISEHEAAFDEIVGSSRDRR